MSLTVLLNGIEYTNWKAATVFRSMESVTGLFSFTSSADEEDAFPINEGDAVNIIVDGTTVLTGFVETIDVESEPDNHDIIIGGRDLLGDLVDDSIGPIKEFGDGEAVSLVDIAKIVLSGIGLSAVNVIDNTDGIQPFDPFDISSAEVGENAFEFLELYARKRQVLLNTDGLGNLVLNRASTELLPIVLKNKKHPNNNDNNVLGSKLRIDTTKRYNNYTVHSQLNPIFLENGAVPKDIVDPVGFATDADIRSTRRLEINSEESSDIITDVDRAKWEANIRRARSFSYSARVQGHSVAGQVWEYNKLIMVDDDFCKTQATLLIRSVRFNASIAGGTTTNLEMTYRDAYTLDVEQSAREATIDDVGSGLI